MQKKNIKNIVLWSTAALIIPALGQLFIDGWNWGLGDFAFAWVFFIILGLVFKFVTIKIANRTYKIIAGAVVIAVFAAMWVMLATG